MESWHYYTCSAIIILLGIPSSLCDSGSGDEYSHGTLIPTYYTTLSIVPSPSTPTYYHTTYHALSTVTGPSTSAFYITPSVVPSLSLMITPTGSVEDKNSGFTSEVITGIIIGILLIVLILLVCIIIVVSYIIRARKRHTQFMEVSLYSYI